MYSIEGLLLSGLNVMPVRDKVPLRRGWPNLVFSLSDFNGKWNQVGLTTGGTLEVIDIDNNSEHTERIFVEMMAVRSVVHRTRSGGYHIIYRCARVGGNQKLARLSDGTTIVETRGTGGYIVIPPSDGYEMVRGSLYDIPLISEADRDRLFRIARTYNQYVPQPIPVYNRDDEQDYDAAYRALLAAGWEVAGRNKLRRPGKREGCSATWGFTPKPYVFYVFSSSAYPFESNRAYCPSQILRLLRKG